MPTEGKSWSLYMCPHVLYHLDGDPTSRSGSSIATEQRNWLLDCFIEMFTFLKVKAKIG